MFIQSVAERSTGHQLLCSYYSQFMAASTTGRFLVLLYKKDRMDLTISLCKSP
jgi:hypothetical protein